MRAIFQGAVSNAESGGFMSERGNAVYRLVDRLAGIPIVAGLSVLRMGRADARALLSSERPKVGLMCFGAIGDLTLATAIVADILAYRPQTNIELITTSANRPVTKTIPGISHNLVIKMTSPLHGIRALRSRKYDVLIDVGQWARISAIYSALSGARATVGFRCPGHFRHYAYGFTGDLRDDRHEVDNFRALLQAVDIPVGSPPRLVPAHEDREKAREICKDWGPFVVFHPWPAGYRSYMREWPAEHWQSLADTLVARGYRIVVTGGPADVDAAAKLVATLPAGTVDLAAKSPLPVVTALLADATAVIAVNTGIMHMACAVGGRVIALNGPTNPMRWGAVSETSVNLLPSRKPYAYLHIGGDYPKGVSYTMDSLEPSRVLAAFEQLVHPSSGG